MPVLSGLEATRRLRQQPELRARADRRAVGQRGRSAIASAAWPPASTPSCTSRSTSTSCCAICRRCCTSRGWRRRRGACWCARSPPTYESGCRLVVSAANPNKQRSRPPQRLDRPLRRRILDQRREPPLPRPLPASRSPPTTLPCARYEGVCACHHAHAALCALNCFLRRGRQVLRRGSRTNRRRQRFSSQRIERALPPPAARGLRRSACACDSTLIALHALPERRGVKRTA